MLWNTKTPERIRELFIFFPGLGIETQRAGTQPYPYVSKLLKAIAHFHIPNCWGDGVKKAKGPRNAVLLKKNYNMPKGSVFSPCFVQA